MVNGTAGLAAVTALGVPLTHRDHAQGVVFVTGHAKTGTGAEHDLTDFGASWPPPRATPCPTLVIYMGATGVAHIQHHCSPACRPKPRSRRCSTPARRISAMS